MAELVKTIWGYRHFVMASIRSDFGNRFARSKVAGLWIVFQPLVQVLIYSVILSSVLAAKLPGVEGQFAYPIYVLSGMLAWGFFSEILLRSTGLFVEFGNNLKKLAFPKLCLPAIVLGTACVSYLIMLGLTLIAVYFLIGLPWALLWQLVPLTVVLGLLALSLGLVLGVLNVFMRDVSQVTQVMMQLLFWFSPIVYPTSIVPMPLRDWLGMSPIVWLLNGFRNILVFQKSIDWSELLIAFGLAAGLMLFALFLVRKASPEMVDAL